MTGDDGAELILDREERFDENDTYVEATAYRVPTSERYPEGVKYSLQYGRTDAPEGDEGTIFRYDNFPDHPDASRHHKHLEDGTAVDVDFDGVLPLYRRFKQEVRDNGENW